MVTIIYESHATSLDNIDGRASGHADVPLAPIGEERARALGPRYAATPLAAVFCSDLQRSYRTAEIAFAGRDIPIIRDPRLREYDYGTLTRAPRDEVWSDPDRCLTEPFPGGESCLQALVRVRAVLEEVLRDYDGRIVLVIGHRATHAALEHWVNGVPLREAVTAAPTWQPGWSYKAVALAKT